MTIDTLTQLIDQEAGHIARLGELFLEQRRIIARADAGQLEKLVQQTSVELTELDWTRSRRREVVRQFCHDQIPLTDLSVFLGARCTDKLRTSIDQVVTAARTLQREAWVNRRIIDRSLHAGDAIFRSICGVVENVTYGQQGSTRANSLLNQQV
jgi:flagellar biosynthesis/type III secretory pathway chaperone